MEQGNAVQTTSGRQTSSQTAKLLLLRINDPYFFGLVRTITGCERIGRFDGRVYRTMPGIQNEESWHGEIFCYGMVEMSIDLSTRPYSGGVLQTRGRYGRFTLFKKGSDSKLARPGARVRV